jgi:hypothetical protein
MLQSATTSVSGSVVRACSYPCPIMKMPGGKGPFGMTLHTPS